MIRNVILWLEAREMSQTLYQMTTYILLPLQQYKCKNDLLSL